MINARVMEVTSRYYMWIKANTELWVYGLPGYLPSLDVKNSDGVNLPVLSPDELNFLLKDESDKELDIMTKERVTQESLHKLMAQTEAGKKSKAPVDASNKKAVHYVGIILPPVGFDHFEEITLKWIEQIETDKKANRCISQHVSRQHTIEPTTTDSAYVDITMDSKKYELRATPEITTVNGDNKPVGITDGNEYKKVLTDKTRCVYRIKRHCPYAFTIKWSIGIPTLVRRWAWAGFLIALAVISFSIAGFVHDQKTFEFNVRLLAGLIAMIVAFRVLLFHDTDLMSRWNRLYLILLGITIGLILIMYLIAQIVA
ncbi:MAG: hypothetical protein KGL95_12305 [Patescibacteria group bacterium]|nr:hypothetical protein [Patescibacteria group bacterium]